MIAARNLNHPGFRHQIYLDLLKQTSIFGHLNDEALRILAHQMSIRQHPAGAMIIHQQEVGEAFYILVKGRAKVVLFGPNGREMILSILAPGDFFGEVAILDGKPRSADVMAMEDTTLLILDTVTFSRHLQNYPQTAIHLLAIIAGRLRQANETISNLALHDVSSRLTRTLLDLAYKEGELCEEGYVLRQRPTQQNLANMLGTCRETVSRALSAMTRQGLISPKGRTLVLRKSLFKN